MKIWFTSDLHFCHDKDFIYKPRGFNSISEMNNTIINNFNEVVNWDDKLYILGDIFLNDDYKGLDLLTKLPGYKYVIWGNHDTNYRKELIESHLPIKITPLGFAHMEKICGQSFYMSHYPTITSNYDDNSKPLNRRVINLFGHTHSTEKFYDGHNPCIYNVAVDAHNCYPVEITTIMQDIKNKIKENSEFRF